jgi:large subunit ribosomal protein L4
MQVPVINLDSKEVGQMILNMDIFGQEKRDDILFRVTHWQMAKARSGCHKAKQRNEVSGSTRKIYRQKGTGQARHGSIKAPIFVGGGIVFGPVVRSHAYSLNKKIRQLGLKIALSVKLFQKSIVVIENTTVENSKTVDLATKLKAFNFKKALFIDNEFNENFKLSANNIKGVNILPTAGLNVLDILKHDKVFITVEGLKKIEERLS